MALQIRRGQTRSFGKMIAVSFAVMAFVLQPLVQSNMPAAFAADEIIDTQAELVDAINGTSPVINIGGDFTVASQININRTLTLNGNGHTVSSTRDNSTATDKNVNNSIFNIAANGVNIRNVILDGANAKKIHGVNIVDYNNLVLTNVTLQNNPQSGLNVNSSQVIVDNITTKHNGWHGIDVDLSKGTVSNSSATLTVLGISHHEGETGGDIFIDDMAKNVTVLDVNKQYSHVDNGMVRIYKLKLAAPTNLTPSYETVTNNNKFSNTWSVVPGAVSYNYEVSSSSSNGTLGAIIWSDNSRAYSNYNVANGVVTRANGKTDDGTYYWRVQAVDANGIAGSWSVIQKVTVDATAPAAPSDLSWLGEGGASAHNGYTNIQNGTLSWKTTTPTDVDHYVYKFWTNIPGYQDDPTNPWYDSYSYVVKTPNGGHVPTDFADKEGTYYFCIEAVDAAGNTSACTQLAITYDKTTPIVQLTAPANGSLTKGMVTISGLVTDANPHHYYLVVKDSHGKVIAGPGVVNQAQVADWNWDTTTVADGQYTIVLEARDAAGNKNSSSIAVRTITVDNTPTVLTIDTSYRVNGDGTYTISGTTDSTDDVTVTFAGVSTTVTPVNGVWRVTTGAIADGTYTATVKSTDAAGNEATATRTYTNVHTPISGEQATVEPPANALRAPARPTQFFAAASQGAVLGDSTEGDKSVAAVKTGQVEGASTTKSDDNAAKAGGMAAWFWWILAAAIASFIWWLIAAARKRASDNN